MSGTKCPYDGDYCEKAAEHFNKWAKFVEFLAKNRINHLFFQGSTNISSCPERAEENCQRYKRYLFIKQNLEKQK